MYSRIAVLEAALAPLGTIGAQFLDDVNSFPSVVILRPMISGKTGEQHQNISSRRATVVRNSIGAEATLNELIITIRGYVCTTIETSLDETEALAREIETVIQSLRSPLLYSAKVLTLHTDEGLFAPYGICDIQCSLEWMIEK
jgi:hypothetical protein